MEHWFDRLARGMAEDRLSRRDAVLRGARVFVAGAFGAGAYGVIAGGAGAQGQECASVVSIPVECSDDGGQAQQMAMAECLAQWAGSVGYCQSQAMVAGGAAIRQCLKEYDRLDQCGTCKYCLYGNCTSICPWPCTRCDPATETCIDTCPPGQYCDLHQGGICQPACPQQCAPYDPASNTCVDKCKHQNNCMECRQDFCQSDCPKPTDYCQDDGRCRPCDPTHCQQLVGSGADRHCQGCDSTCERCENGTCVDTCPAGQICCLGKCITCCGGQCDRKTGYCTGNECSGGTPYCLDGLCSACAGNVAPATYSQCGPSSGCQTCAFPTGYCCSPGWACCQYMEVNPAPGVSPGPYWQCYDPSQQFCCDVGPCSTGQTCFPGCGCCGPGECCVNGECFTNCG